LSDAHYKNAQPDYTYESLAYSTKRKVGWQIRGLELALCMLYKCLVIMPQWLLAQRIYLILSVWGRGVKELTK